MLKTICTTILLLVWCILFFSALNIYSESKVLYSLFSFVSLLLLISALYRTISYSYLFLTLFLWLGIWLKLTLHLIFDYDYVEATGSFYPLNTKMDDVLIVAICGLLGVLITNIIYRINNIPSTIRIMSSDTKVPLIFEFYQQYKFIIFIVIFITALTLSLLNLIFGIQLSGLVPQTLLIFPLNALVYWILKMGLGLLVIVLISWSIFYKKELNVKDLIFYIVVIGITSVGILSRGQYVFMSGSIIIFLLYNYQFHKNINLKKIFLFIVFVGFVYYFVIYGVTILRDYYFSGITSPNTSISRTFSTLFGLIVDRWVGLEGLMSVVSYTDRSFSLLINSLINTPEIGKIDIYQYIANSHYKDMDNTKYAFATIPGAIAFLYYSNSLWIVFLGMFLLSAVMLTIEYLFFNWMKSSLLASVLGIYLSNIVAQFGLMPINILKSLFLVFSFLFMMIFLKKYLFEKIYIIFTREK